MAEEHILTRHPLGKRGRSISRDRYDTIKRAILSALTQRDLTHTELMEALSTALKGAFAGNVHWYGETVKLDLEARDLIERTASKPAKYRCTRRGVGSRSDRQRA